MPDIEKIEDSIHEVLLGDSKKRALDFAAYI